MAKKKVLEEVLIEELTALFHDKNAEGLSAIDNSLYQRIANYSRDKEIGVEDLLNSWGFQYRGRVNFSMSIEVILAKTEELYPNKTIESIMEFKKENDTMYQRLVFLLKRSKTPSEFFLENGFTINNRLKKVITDKKDNGEHQAIKLYNYDKVALTEILKYYDLNMNEFAQRVGVTRETIRIAPKSREVKRGYPLYPEILEDEELNVVFRAIDKRVFTYEENGYFVKLLRKKAGKASPYNDIALVVVKESKAKCFLYLPDYVEERLDFKGLLRYNEKDFKILNIMDELPESWSINKNEEIEFLDERYSSLISAGLRLFKAEDKNSARKEYVYYLTGFYPKTRNKSDDDILEIIQRNVYDDVNKYVHLSTYNDEKADYSRLRRETKRRGLSNIHELIESFDYIYKPKPRTYKDIFSEYVEIIKEYYVVEGDKVYIKTDELFANRITTYGSKKGLTLDGLINELGFTRIKKEDLPEGYVYRSYTQSKRKSNSLIVQVLNELEELEIDKVIDLSSNTKLNLRIRRAADMVNKSSDEFLNYYGYIRKDSIKTYESSVNSEDSDEEDEKLFKEKLLKEIKKIQGTLKSCNTQNEKVERSQLLVTKLKKLYNYQCQLCDPEGVGFQAPIIEMKNGHAYVELHHIKQIANALKADEDEEIKELDKYTNAIILCCHHHKYVHLHKGGYKELHKDENDEVFVKSEDGDSLKLYLNEHLLKD